MEELFAIKDIFTLFEGNELIVMLCIMLIAFYPLLFTVRKVVEPAINKVAKSKGETYANILKKHNLKGKLSIIFIALYLMFWGDIFDKSQLMTDVAVRVKNLVFSVFIIVAITSFLLMVVNIAVDLYQTKSVSKKIPINLHAQILKIVITICSGLTILSSVLGIQISSVFASLGAAAALLTFVFKDAVLGLVASLQLTFQDIIRPGDWVSLPSYNADGDVEKITITVVVIRNFDKTYTTVPTSAFLTTGVKNWRGMVESGGRRIKRSINIDMDSVTVCDQDNLNRFKKLSYMKDFAKQNQHLFNAKNEITNLTIFRHYIEQYLKANQNIHQQGFTFLVRHLDPSPTGLPIELYIFTADTNWINYERIQADIFDHLLGVMPRFHLKVFQSVVLNQVT